MSCGGAGRRCGSMRKLAPWLLLALFLVALVARTTLSMAQGDVYPEWSTLRSDPMGAKVLFVALEGTPGLHVEQNFEAWADLPGRRAENVVLGGLPVILREPVGGANVPGGRGQLCCGGVAR